MGTIQPAIRLNRFANHRFHFGNFGHINLHKGGVTTVFRNHVNGLLSTVFIHIGDNQLCTFSGKGQGSGSADA